MLAFRAHSGILSCFNQRHKGWTDQQLKEEDGLPNISVVSEVYAHVMDQLIKAQQVLDQLERISVGLDGLGSAWGRNVLTQYLQNPTAILENQGYLLRTQADEIQKKLWDLQSKQDQTPPDQREQWNKEHDEQISDLQRQNEDLQQQINEHDKQYQQTKNKQMSGDDPYDHFLKDDWSNHGNVQWDLKISLSEENFAAGQVPAQAAVDSDPLVGRYQENRAPPIEKGLSPISVRDPMVKVMTSVLTVTCSVFIGSKISSLWAGGLDDLGLFSPEGSVLKLNLAILAFCVAVFLLALIGYQFWAGYKDYCSGVGLLPKREKPAESEDDEELDTDANYLQFEYLRIEEKNKKRIEDIDGAAEIIKSLNHPIGGHYYFLYYFSVQENKNVAAGIVEIQDKKGVVVLNVTCSEDHMSRCLPERFLIDEVSERILPRQWKKLPWSDRTPVAVIVDKKFIRPSRMFFIMPHYVDASTRHDKENLYRSVQQLEIPFEPASQAYYVRNDWTWKDQRATFIDALLFRPVYGGMNAWIWVDSFTDKIVEGIVLAAIYNYAAKLEVFDIYEWATDILSVIFISFFVSPVVAKSVARLVVKRRDSRFPTSVPPDEPIFERKIESQKVLYVIMKNLRVVSILKFLSTALFVALVPGSIFSDGLGTQFFINIQSPRVYLGLMLAYWLLMSLISEFDFEYYVEAKHGSMSGSIEGQQRGFYAINDVLENCAAVALRAFQASGLLIGVGVLLMGWKSLIVPLVFGLSIAYVLQNFYFLRFRHDFGLYLKIHDTDLIKESEGTFLVGDTKDVRLHIKPHNDQYRGACPVQIEKGASLLPWLEELEVRISFKKTPAIVNQKGVITLKFENTPLITVGHAYGKLELGCDMVVEQNQITINSLRPKNDGHLKIGDSAPLPNDHPTRSRAMMQGVLRSLFEALRTGSASFLGAWVLMFAAYVLGESFYTLIPAAFLVGAVMPWALSLFVSGFAISIEEIRRHFGNLDNETFIKNHREEDRKVIRRFAYATTPKQWESQINEFNHGRGRTVSFNRGLSLHGLNHEKCECNALAKLLRIRLPYPQTRRAMQSHGGPGENRALSPEFSQGPLAMAEAEKNNRRIIIFDSGKGGEIIAQDIETKLKQEGVINPGIKIYVHGKTVGGLDKESIRAIFERLVNQALEEGATDEDIFCIACNTAAALGMKDIILGKLQRKKVGTRPRILSPVDMLIKDINDSRHKGMPAILLMTKACRVADEPGSYFHGLMRCGLNPMRADSITDVDLSRSMTWLVSEQPLVEAIQANSNKLQEELQRVVDLLKRLLERGSHSTHTIGLACTHYRQVMRDLDRELIKARVRNFRIVDSNLRLDDETIRVFKESNSQETALSSPTRANEELIEDSDKDLVKLALSGSQDAYTELYKKYWPLAYSMAMRRLWIHEDACDAAQEALRKAFRFLDKFEGRNGSSFKTWISTVISNHITKCVQSRARRLVNNHVPIDSQDESIFEDPASDSLGRLWDQEDSQVRVAEALAKIKKEFRTILRLFYVDQKSYETIGKVLGLNIGTVKSRLAYAKEALKKALKRIDSKKEENQKKPTKFGNKSSRMTGLGLLAAGLWIGSILGQAQTFMHQSDPSPGTMLILANSFYYPAVLLIFAVIAGALYWRISRENLAGVKILQETGRLKTHRRSKHNDKAVSLRIRHKSGRYYLNIVIAKNKNDGSFSGLKRLLRTAFVEELARVSKDDIYTVLGKVIATVLERFRLQDDVNLALCLVPENSQFVHLAYVGDPFIVLARDEQVQEEVKGYFLKKAHHISIDQLPALQSVQHDTGIPDDLKDQFNDAKLEIGESCIVFRVIRSGKHSLLSPVTASTPQGLVINVHIGVAKSFSVAMAEGLTILFASKRPSVRENEAYSYEKSSMEKLQDILDGIASGKGLKETFNGHFHFAHRSMGSLIRIAPALSKATHKSKTVMVSFILAVCFVLAEPHKPACPDSLPISAPAVCQVMPVRRGRNRRADSGSAIVKAVSPWCLLWKIVSATTQKKTEPLPQTNDQAQVDKGQKPEGPSQASRRKFLTGWRRSSAQTQDPAGSKPSSGGVLGAVSKLAGPMSRRDFVKTSAAAGAAVTTLGPAAAGTLETAVPVAAQTLTWLTPGMQLFVETWLGGKSWWSSKVLREWFGFSWERIEEGYSLSEVIGNLCMEVVEPTEQGLYSGARDVFVQMGQLNRSEIWLLISKLLPNAILVEPNKDNRFMHPRTLNRTFLEQIMPGQDRPDQEVSQILAKRFEVFVVSHAVMSRAFHGVDRQPWEIFQRFLNGTFTDQDILWARYQQACFNYSQALRKGDPEAQGRYKQRADRARQEMERSGLKLTTQGIMVPDAQDLIVALKPTAMNLFWQEGQLTTVVLNDSSIGRDWILNESQCRQIQQWLGLANRAPPTGEILIDFQGLTNLELWQAEFIPPYLREQVQRVFVADLSSIESIDPARHEGGMTDQARTALQGLWQDTQIQGAIRQARELLTDKAPLSLALNRMGYQGAARIWQDAKEINAPDILQSRLDAIEQQFGLKIYALKVIIEGQFYIIHTKHSTSQQDKTLNNIHETVSQSLEGRGLSGEQIDRRASQAEEMVSTMMEIGQRLVSCEKEALKSLASIKVFGQWVKRLKGNPLVQGFARLGILALHSLDKAAEALLISCENDERLLKVLQSVERAQAGTMLSIQEDILQRASQLARGYHPGRRDFIGTLSALTAGAMAPIGLVQGVSFESPWLANLSKEKISLLSRLGGCLTHLHGNKDNPQADLSSFTGHRWRRTDVDPFDSETFDFARQVLKYSKENPDFVMPKLRELRELLGVFYPGTSLDEIISTRSLSPRGRFFAADHNRVDINPSLRELAARGLTIESSTNNLFSNPKFDFSAIACEVDSAEQGFRLMSPSALQDLASRYPNAPGLRAVFRLLKGESPAFLEQDPWFVQLTQRATALEVSDQPAGTSQAQLEPKESNGAISPAEEDPNTSRSNPDAPPVEAKDRTLDLRAKDSKGNRELAELLEKRIGNLAQRIAWLNRIEEKLWSPEHPCLTKDEQDYRDADKRDKERLRLRALMDQLIKLQESLDNHDRLAVLSCPPSDPARHEGEMTAQASTRVLPAAPSTCRFNRPDMPDSRDEVAKGACDLTQREWPVWMDIGSGFGSLAKHLAEQGQASVIAMDPAYLDNSQHPGVTLLKSMEAKVRLVDQGIQTWDDPSIHDKVEKIFWFFPAPNTHENIFKAAVAKIALWLHPQGEFVLFTETTRKRWGTFVKMLEQKGFEVKVQDTGIDYSNLETYLPLIIHSETYKALKDRQITLSNSFTIITVTHKKETSRSASVQNSQNSVQPARFGEASARQAIAGNAGQWHRGLWRRAKALIVPYGTLMFRPKRDPLEFFLRSPDQGKPQTDKPKIKRYNFSWGNSQEDFNREKRFYEQTLAQYPELKAFVPGLISAKTEQDEIVGKYGELELTRLPGDDFLAFLTSQRSSGVGIDPGKVLPYINSILAILKVFHQKGVILPDFKPNNIIISPTRKVYFIDFGAAVYENEFSRSDTDKLCVTPGFKSWEFQANLPITPATNVYSVGVMVWFMAMWDVFIKEEYEIDFVQYWTQLINENIRLPKQEQVDLMTDKLEKQLPTAWKPWARFIALATAPQGISGIKDIEGLESHMLFLEENASLPLALQDQDQQKALLNAYWQYLDSRNAAELKNITYHSAEEETMFLVLSILLDPDNSSHVKKCIDDWVQEHETVVDKDAGITKRDNDFHSPILRAVGYCIWHAYKRALLANTGFVRQLIEENRGMESPAIRYCAEISRTHAMQAAIKLHEEYNLAVLGIISPQAVDETLKIVFTRYRPTILAMWGIFDWVKPRKASNQRLGRQESQALRQDQIHHLAQGFFVEGFTLRAQEVMELIGVAIKQTDSKKADLIVLTILLPLFFKFPRIFTSVCPRINWTSLLEKAPSAKYLLFYVESFSRTYVYLNDEQFPAQRRINQIIGIVNCQVLIITPSVPGLGDELIAVGGLLQGLLDVNPALTAHIVSNRPVLYDRPGITVLTDIPDLSSYDLVIDLRRSQPTRAEFKGKLKARVFHVSSLSSSMNIQFSTGPIISFDKTDSMNAYAQSLVLCAQMGLSLRFGTQRRRDSFFIGRQDDRSIEVQGLRDEMRVNNVEHRPTIFFLPFGGASASKGIDQQTAVQYAHVMIQAGFFLVVAQNATPWGTRERASEIIKGLNKWNEESLAMIGPDPKNYPDIFKYYITKCNVIVAVEGLMEHLAFQVGRPCAIIVNDRTNLTYDQWGPIAADLRQVALRSPEELVRYLKSIRGHEDIEIEIGAVRLDAVPGLHPWWSYIGLPLFLPKPIFRWLATWVFSFFEELWRAIRSASAGRFAWAHRGGVFDVQIWETRPTLERDYFRLEFLGLLVDKVSNPIYAEVLSKEFKLSLWGKRILINKDSWPRLMKFLAFSAKVYAAWMVHAEFNDAAFKAGRGIVGMVNNSPFQSPPVTHPSVWGGGRRESYQPCRVNPYGVMKVNRQGGAVDTVTRANLNVSRGLSADVSLWGFGLLDDFKNAVDQGRQNSRRIRVLIIGVGSGLIAFSLKQIWPDKDVEYVLINKEAIHLTSEDLLNAYLSQDESRIINIYSGPNYREPNEEEMAKFMQDFERSAVIYDVDNGLSAYADEDFDFVLVASNTLRYIRMKGLLLEEIKRVLKDGAVGYVQGIGEPDQHFIVQGFEKLEDYFGALNNNGGFNQYKIGCDETEYLKSLRIEKLNSAPFPELVEVGEPELLPQQGYFELPPVWRVTYAPGLPQRAIFQSPCDSHSAGTSEHRPSNHLEVGDCNNCLFQRLKAEQVRSGDGLDEVRLFKQQMLASQQPPGRAPPKTDASHVFWMADVNKHLTGRLRAIAAQYPVDVITLPDSSLLIHVLPVGQKSKTNQTLKDFLEHESAWVAGQMQGLFPMRVNILHRRSDGYFVSLVNGYSMQITHDEANRHSSLKGQGPHVGWVFEKNLKGKGARYLLYAEDQIENNKPKAGQKPLAVYGPSNGFDFVKHTIKGRGKYEPSERSTRRLQAQADSKNVQAALEELFKERIRRIKEQNCFVVSLKSLHVTQEIIDQFIESLHIGRETWVNKDSPNVCINATAIDRFLRKRGNGLENIDLPKFYIKAGLPPAKGGDWVVHVTTTNTGVRLQAFINQYRERLNRIWIGDESTKMSEGNEEQNSIWVNPSPKRHVELEDAIVLAEEFLKLLHIDPTPLVELGHLSHLISQDRQRLALLKDESRRLGESFKILGVLIEVKAVFVELISRAKEEKIDVNSPYYIVTQTVGNHGIALILAVAILVKHYQEKNLDDPKVLQMLSNIEPVIFTVNQNELPDAKRKGLEQAMEYYRGVQHDQNKEKGAIYNQYQSYPLAELGREAYMQKHRKQASYMEHGNIKIMSGHALSAIEIMQELLRRNMKGKKVLVLYAFGAGGPQGFAGGLKWEAHRQGDVNQVVAVGVQSIAFGAGIRELITGKSQENVAMESQRVGLDDAASIIFEDGIAVTRTDKKALEVARCEMDLGLIADAKRAFQEAAPLIYADLYKAYGGENVKLGGTTALAAQALLSHKDFILRRYNPDIVVVIATEGNVDSRIEANIRQEAIDRYILDEWMNDLTDPTTPSKDKYKIVWQMAGLGGGVINEINRHIESNLLTNPFNKEGLLGVGTLYCGLETFNPELFRVSAPQCHQAEEMLSTAIAGRDVSLLHFRNGKLVHINENKEPNDSIKDICLVDDNHLPILGDVELGIVGSSRTHYDHVGIILNSVRRGYSDIKGMVCIFHILGRSYFIGRHSNFLQVLDCLGINETDQLRQLFLGDCQLDTTIIEKLRAATNFYRQEHDRINLPGASDELIGELRKNGLLGDRVSLNPIHAALLNPAHILHTGLSMPTFLQQRLDQDPQHRPNAPGYLGCHAFILAIFWSTMLLAGPNGLQDCLMSALRSCMLIMGMAGSIYLLFKFLSCCFRSVFYQQMIMREVRRFFDLGYCLSFNKACRGMFVTVNHHDSKSKKFFRPGKANGIFWIAPEEQNELRLNWVLPELPRGTGLGRISAVIAMILMGTSDSLRRRFRVHDTTWELCRSFRHIPSAHVKYNPKTFWIVFFCMRLLGKADKLRYELTGRIPRLSQNAIDEIRQRNNANFIRRFGHPLPLLDSTGNQGEPMLPTSKQPLDQDPQHRPDAQGSLGCHAFVPAIIMSFFLSTDVKDLSLCFYMFWFVFVGIVMPISLVMIWEKWAPRICSSTTLNLLNKRIFIVALSAHMSLLMIISLLFPVNSGFRNIMAFAPTCFLTFLLIWPEKSKTKVESEVNDFKSRSKERINNEERSRSIKPGRRGSVFWHVIFDHWKVYDIEKKRWTLIIFWPEALEVIESLAQATDKAYDHEYRFQKSKGRLDITADELALQAACRIHEEFQEDAFARRPSFILEGRVSPVLGMVWEETTFQFALRLRQQQQEASQVEPGPSHFDPAMATFSMVAEANYPQETPTGQALMSPVTNIAMSSMLSPFGLPDTIILSLVNELKQVGIRDIPFYNSPQAKRWAGFFIAKARQSRSREHRRIFLQLSRLLIALRGDPLARGHSQVYWINWPGHGNIPVRLSLPEGSLGRLPTILLWPGLSTEKEAAYLDIYEEAFLQRGFAVLRIDLPGHGQNKACLKDALDIESFLHSIEAGMTNTDGLKARVDPQQLSSIGFSLGGTFALWAQAHGMTQSCVVINSPMHCFFNDGQENSYYHDALARLFMDRRPLSKLEDLSIMPLTGRLRRHPISIIASGKDRVMGLEGRFIQDNLPQAKIIAVADGRHYLSQDQQRQTVGEVVGFIEGIRAERIRNITDGSHQNLQPSYLIQWIESKTGKPNWIARLALSPWVVPHELGNLMQAVLSGRLGDIDPINSSLLAGLVYTNRAPPCVGGTLVNLLLGVFLLVFSPHFLVSLYAILSIIYAVIEIYCICLSFSKMRRDLFGIFCEHYSKEGLMGLAHTQPKEPNWIRGTLLNDLPSVYQGIDRTSLTYLWNHESNDPSGSAVYDRGSGDGRIVVLYALRGYRSYGWEYNRETFDYSVRTTRSFIEKINQCPTMPHFREVEQSDNTCYVWQEENGSGRIELRRVDINSDEARFDPNKTRVVFDWSANQANGQYLKALSELPKVRVISPFSRGLAALPNSYQLVRSQDISGASVYVYEKLNGSLLQVNGVPQKLIIIFLRRQRSQKRT